jgi:hypothetical protein
VRSAIRRLLWADRRALTPGEKARFLAAPLAQFLREGENERSEFGVRALWIRLGEGKPFPLR